jgi:ppGpp synthetase/RelA/SpoT-type nucleotidyltranferase
LRRRARDNSDNSDNSVHLFSFFEHDHSDEIAVIMATKRIAEAKPLAKAAVTADERLVLDVVEALRGADNLKDRLLTALQSGTPAVSDIAYAVKARVKEDYKVVDKIIDRRSGKSDRPAKPNYRVSDVTDIVGLRIITLYRLDALEVIEALLTAMERDKSASAPFVANSISEVIIYTANPEGDVQKLPKLLQELFKDHGLGAVTKIDSRSTNYSSIHVVARGRGKYREGYRELPIEIQIRTALEDVWGQIEHGLKYKRKRIAVTDDASGAERRLTTTLDHLGALKTMVDGIAQYADQIKLQIDELEPELRYSASKSAEDPSARLAALKDLKPEIQAEIARAIGEARPGLVDANLPQARRVAILRSALSHLEAVADEIPTIADLSQKSRKELRYIVSMQRALAHFQLGNLIESGDRQLGRALALYTEVERDFPDRLIVAYRLARTLDALGARDDAIGKMRDVVGRLSEKGPLPEDHWVRAAAPRGLGVLLWESVDLKSLSGPADASTLNVLREAYHLTEAAHAVTVFDDPLSGAALSERARAANNLLYYLLEYLEVGGPPVSGMEESDLIRLLGEITTTPIEEVQSLSMADTMRRAFAHLNDRDQERAAARQVITLAATGPTPRAPIIRDAVRNAERTLERDEDVEAAITVPPATARRRSRRPRRPQPVAPREPDGEKP